jgi:hypothetical protein
VVLGTTLYKKINNNNLTLTAYRKKAPQESLSLVKNLTENSVMDPESLDPDPGFLLNQDQNQRFLGPKLCEVCGRFLLTSI